MVYAEDQHPVKTTCQEGYQMQDVADRFNAKLPRGQSIHLDLPVVFRHSRLKLSIPDLSDFDSQIDGDWGPSYRITTKGKAEVVFQYEDPQKNQLLKHNLYPNEIEFKSPILNKTREKTPWLLEVQDPEYGLNVACYFDHHGFVEKTKVGFPEFHDCTTGKEKS